MSAELYLNLSFYLSMLGESGLPGLPGTDGRPGIPGKVTFLSIFSDIVFV